MSAASTTNGARCAPAIAAALQASRKALLLIAVFSAGVNLLMFASPLFMAQVFDRILPARSMESLVYLTLMAIVALGVMCFLEATRARLANRIAAFLDIQLAPAAFGRAVSSAVQGHGTGVQPLRDLAQIRSFLTSSALFSLFDTPWLPLYLGIVFLVHWAVGVVALAGAVIIFSVAVLNEQRTRAVMSSGSARANRAVLRAEVAVRNAEVVEGMGMLSGYGREWIQDLFAASADLTAAADRSATYTSFARIVRLAIQVLMYACGAWLVLDQKLSPGSMMAASIIMARGLAPIEAAIGGWKGLVVARAAYHRLNQLLSEPSLRSEGMVLPAPTGRVTVDRLSYAPRGSQHLLLKNVSFELAPGEVLAIAGPSGAGKSTLARALMGVVPPTAGHVRLDGAEIRSWDRMKLGAYLGYLPQDIELFDGTVRANIARMGEAADAEVVAAAKLADVHELILHLPHGYHTRVGDGGARLSTGQRQRVALARALFGTPKLVVLDEPDSALDADGELALEHAIHALKAAGSTVVVVTHRPRLLAVVDKILVLRAGAVEAIGPAAEIAQRTRPAAGDAAATQALLRARLGVVS